MRLLIVVAAWLLPTLLAHAELPQLPVVTVIACETASDDCETNPLEMPASVAHFDKEQLPSASSGRIEEILSYDSGLGSSIEQQGLGTAFTARGYAITRTYINNLPDTQRFLVRDFSLIESVRVLKGHSGVLYGNGQPGATLNITSPRPSKNAKARVGLGYGSYELGRLHFDSGNALNPGPQSGLRLTGATQRGNSYIRNVPVDRDALLAAWEWNGGGEGDGNTSTTILMTSEWQRDQRPFPMGIVQIGSTPLYDISYVSPQAEADRRYWRHSLELRHNLNRDWQLSVLNQTAVVKRDEMIAGVFTIVSPTELSGYYRRLRDDYRQYNGRIEINGQFTALLSQELLVGVDYGRQSVDFDGPQNIDGFRIDPRNPDFSNVDVHTLPLTPSVNREEYRERALYAQNRIKLSERWRYTLGARATRLTQDRDRGAGFSRQTDIKPFNISQSLLYRAGSHASFWLSQSESFEPVRGLARNGQPLPPLEAEQVEIGVRAYHGPLTAELAAYRLTQENLTGRDPLDRNFLAPLGARRSQGAELDVEYAWNKHWKLKTGGSRLSARNTRKASASLGESPVNIPRSSGYLRLDGSRALAAGVLSGGIGWTAVTSRPGDAANSFRAPGYCRWDASLQFTRGPWAFRLDSFNLTDLRYIAALTGKDDIMQGERRRLMGTAEWRF